MNEPIRELMKKSSGQYKVAAFTASVSTPASSPLAMDTIGGKEGGKATMAVGAMIPVSLQ